MRDLVDFRPELSGPLVGGDGPLEHVRLLLTADSPEQVIFHLRDRGLPWQSAEAGLHFAEGRRTCPALRFVAGESTIELVVLDARQRSDPPRDPLSGARLQTLDIDALQALIDTER